MDKKLSDIATGLGAGGAPRMGKPKTDAERRATHKARTGSSKLPPRGTGLRSGEGVFGGGRARRRGM